MDYEIKEEVDYIVGEIEDMQYGRDSGEEKVIRAMRSIGRGDQKTINEALRYFEKQCDRKGL